MDLSTVRYKFTNRVNEILRDNVDDGTISSQHRRASRRRLRKFILEHERLPVVLQNLCAEIENAERSMGNRFQKQQLDELIDAAAKMFITGCLTHQEQKFLSEAQKQAIMANEQAELDEMYRTYLKDGLIEETTRDTMNDYIVKDQAGNVMEKPDRDRKAESL